MTCNTFKELVGENALEVVGCIARLLTQLERQIPEMKGTADRYRAEALSGDYGKVIEVSHEYAYQYLATTLKVEPELEAYWPPGPEDPWEEEGLPVSHAF